MKFENTIPKIPLKNAAKINSVMLDACLAYVNNSNWRQIFTRARVKAIGTQRKAFELLENTDTDGMERLCNVMEREYGS